MKLNKLQKSQIKKIGDKFNLKMILMHGSYAKREQKPGSDLDIAVVGVKYLDNEGFLALHAELARVLGNSKDRELDLKELKNSNPLFLYEVMNNALLLYGSEMDILEMKAYAYKLYCDSKKLFELEKTLANRYQNYLNQKYAQQ